jgi:hypothetical protein
MVGKDAAKLRKNRQGLRSHPRIFLTFAKTQQTEPKTACYVAGFIP